MAGMCEMDSEGKLPVIQFGSGLITLHTVTSPKRNFPARQVKNFLCAL